MSVKKVIVKNHRTNWRYCQ